MSTTIRSNNYSIFLGNDTFYQLGKFLSRNNYNDSKKIILVDENTKEHCLPLIQNGVLGLQGAVVLEIKAGEASKNIKTVEMLWQQLTQHHHIDRHSLIVNLGGGVVMDIGGFVASTYLRGIDFVNVPTTLLAMVDASVGGKNGINFGGFKNHIGTFTDPRAVFVSPVFLKTLSQNEIRSGFAEIIKHALISDFNKWREVKAIDSLELVDWTNIISESIWTKNKIVNSDFRDRHWRKALNFGHTIGHALESYSQENNSPALKHGEAIAIGIIGETWISQQLCGLHAQEANDIYSFIQKHYPINIEFNADALIEIMTNDKKNQFGKVNFALIRGIGQPVIKQMPNEEMVKQALVFSKQQMADQKPKIETVSAP